MRIGVGSGTENVIGVRFLDDSDAVLDVAETLQDVLNNKFGFIVAGNLVSEEFVDCKLRGIPFPDDKPYSSWYDLRVASSDWCVNVVGVLRNLEEQLEGDDFVVCERAKDVLLRELNYAHHLGLPAVILELNKLTSVNYARIIHTVIVSANHLSEGPKIWIKVPMGLEENESQFNPDGSKITSWSIWNRFRSLCNFEQRLSAALELPVNLPDPDEINRWFGEPVKCLFISTRCFISNSKGFPVLPKNHQEVLRRCMYARIQVVINCDSQDDKTPLGLDRYRRYIEFIYSNMMADQEQEAIRSFTAGYEDCLQSPLQPLKDNLESHTYEVFEKDPVKYKLYEQAVGEALLHLVPESEQSTKQVVVMVLGAGRGPLVSSSIRAAALLDRKVKFYALEKNANAVNTLLHLKDTRWKKNDVTVICSDMRTWEPPEKADIIVSELLGSFGDNELSPECLDGGQKFLKPGGIMIPQSYSSYASPIMSNKLYCEARRYNDSYKNPYYHFEVPYVVHMKTRYEVSSPKKVFSFSHPKPDPGATNNRYTTLKFTVPQDCLMHGFAGYFESCLYGTTVMSILPATFSKGMFSWFPIYFPIREPLQLKKGDEIVAHFWRCSNSTSVWYEWTVSCPVSLPIHNPGGRSYTIGL